MVYPHTYRTEHSETHTTSSMYGAYYRMQVSKKISIQPPLLKILQYVDSNRERFLEDLTEFVKIKSIASELKYRSEVQKMINAVEEWFVKLGVRYECFNIGWQELDGQKVRLPTVMLGTLGNDPTKKTICVYGWLDVNRPDKSAWKSKPWSVTEVQRRIFGVGVSVGKASVLAWLHVVQAFQSAEIDIPVNLKFIIESMHYQDHLGLDAFLALRRQDFFFNVKYVVVCDTEWIGDKYPCLTYGSVGFLHYSVTIEKAESSQTDIREDMEKIFKTVCDDQERILIPKFNEFVQQITPDEEQVYEAIHWDVDEIRDKLPDYKKDWDKVKLLMHFWRLPSIMVGPIEECSCEKNEKNKIRRTFTIKIVPRQMVETSTKLVMQHFNHVTKELKIDNKVDVKLISATRPWANDIWSPAYEAARRATIQIYKEDPNMIREDRDMKVVTMMHRTLEKSVLVLPMGDNLMHSGRDNENILLKHFYEGVKLLGAYLFQISYIKD